MPLVMLSVIRISAENLRGYTKTALNLNQLTVLVGENNDGKSSLLKMFERMLSFPDDFWAGELELSDEEMEFWYPANDAQHRARRFTLSVRFSDGKVARKYGLKKNDETSLRLGISSDGTCRLNVGQPRRSETHDPKAFELLKLVQSELHLIVIPPVRDSRSSEFTRKLTRSVTDELSKRLSHNRRAGAPKEYRLAKDAIAKIESIVRMHARGLKSSSKSPLGTMLSGSEVRIELLPRDIYELIERSLSVHLSTGTHDINKVAPNEVGNGLQSLIDIDLTIEQFVSVEQADSRTKLVIIEEPEAFLHPSAQRQFMQFLREALSSQRINAAILTTHSPTILDEARYEEITLVRNQKHYAPTATDAQRRGINTSLMTSAAAEVFFARTVVFVEGEGDRAFLNTLIRRIRAKVPVTRELASIVIQPTGGCTFFAPWLRLVQSYGAGEDRPIRHIWVMDGDVLSNDRSLFMTASECGFPFNDSEREVLLRLGDADWQPADRRSSAVAPVNSALMTRSGFLFCCDLEWAFFNMSSAASIDMLRKSLTELGVDSAGNEVELARRLGSKIGTGTSVNSPKKQPHIRARIAENLVLNELPPEVFNLLKYVFSKALGSDSAARELFRRANVGVAGAQPSRSRLTPQLAAA